MIESHDSSFLMPRFKVGSSVATLLLGCFAVSPTRAGQKFTHGDNLVILRILFHILPGILRLLDELAEGEADVPVLIRTGAGQVQDRELGRRNLSHGVSPAGSSGGSSQRASKGNFRRHTDFAAKATVLLSVEIFINNNNKWKEFLNIDERLAMDPTRPI